MPTNPKTIAKHKAVAYWANIWRIPVGPAATKFMCRSGKWQKAQIKRFMEE